MTRFLTQTDRSTAHFAGLLYLVIIVFGITSEVALRGPLIDFADAQTTARTILAGAGRFHLSLAADLVMAAADAGLAVLLFVLFRPVAPGLALAAMVFRLIQTAVIAVSLMNMQAAWLLLSAGQDAAALDSAQIAGLANLFLNLHAHGYDLGLMFFGVNSLLTGLLIWRSGFAPQILGAGMALAGAVYLLGSAIRFFAPGAAEAFAPAYGLTMLAESAFCLWLLSAGWRQRNARLA